MAKLGAKTLLFFFLRRQIVTYRQQATGLLMISVSARFLSDATLAMARLLQEILFFLKSIISF